MSGQRGGEFWRRQLKMDHAGDDEIAAVILSLAFCEHDMPSLDGSLD